MAENQSSEALTPQSDDVGQRLSLIDEAKKDARDYHKTCERIKKRYRYENSMTVKRRKFQISGGAPFPSYFSVIRSYM